MYIQKKYLYENLWWPLEVKYEEIIVLPKFRLVAPHALCVKHSWPYMALGETYLTSGVTTILYQVYLVLHTSNVATVAKDKYPSVILISLVNNIAQKG